MNKCPKCGTTPTGAAEFCPLCGFRLPRERSGYLILFFFGLVALIVFAVIGHRANDTPTDDKYTASRSAARVMAQKFVLNKLVSPATAKFSDESETEIQGYGDSWMVAGWVDSQNVYGALIRSRYRVTLKPVENGRWQASEVLVVDR